MKRTHRAAVLAVVLAVAVGIRLQSLGNKCVNFIESESILLASQGIGRIVEIGRDPRGVNPPLYYLALHAWRSAFGDGVVPLRSLSVVFGALTVVGAYRLAREVSTGARAEQAGLLAATLVALNPAHVENSRLIRAYELGAMLAVWSGWALLRALRRDGGAGFAWVPFVLLNLAGCLVHYTFVLTTIAQVLFLFLFIFNPRPGRSSRSRRWPVAVALVLIAVAFWAWFPVFLGQARSAARDVTAHPSVEGLLIQVVLTIEGTQFSQPSSLVDPVSLVLVVGLPALLAWAIRRGEPGLIYLAIAGTVPVLGLVAFSAVSDRCIVTARYLAICQTSWIVLFASYCGASDRVKSARLVSIAAVAASVAWCRAEWPVLGPSAMPGMRRAAADIAGKYREGDLVVTTSSLEFLTLDHYARGAFRPLLVVGSVRQGPPRGAEVIEPRSLISLDDLKGSSAGGIWTVTSRTSPEIFRTDFDPPDHWARAESSLYSQDFYSERPIVVNYYVNPRRARAPGAPLTPSLSPNGARAPRPLLRGR